jgi:two-component system sensor histidine kinase GlrK
VELRIDSAVIDIDDENVPAVSVRVLDSGPGVPEEDRERIFAPFEQGGDPMTGKPPGIGLGLHEAKVVAEQHRGMLEFLPRMEGGSEFRLTVPLKKENVGEGQENRGE